MYYTILSQDIRCLYAVARKVKLAQSSFTLPEIMFHSKKGKIQFFSLHPNLAKC